MSASRSTVVGLTTEQKLEREKRRRKAAEEKTSKVKLENVELQRRLILLSAEKAAAVDAEEEETIRWMTNYNILKESSETKIQGLEQEVAKHQEFLEIAKNQYKELLDRTLENCQKLTQIHEKGAPEQPTGYDATDYYIDGFGTTYEKTSSDEE